MKGRQGNLLGGNDAPRAGEALLEEPRDEDHGGSDDGSDDGGNGSPPGWREDGPLRRLIDDNFIQYASYVIRDRAIPDLIDGLKPVQRRILHSLHENDDGKLIKVANLALLAAERVREANIAPRHYDGDGTEIRGNLST